MVRILVLFYCVLPFIQFWSVNSYLAISVNFIYWCLELSMASYLYLQLVSIFFYFFFPSFFSFLANQPIDKTQAGWVANNPLPESPMFYVSSCFNWVLKVKPWSFKLVEYLNIVDKDFQLIITKFTCWKLNGVIDMFDL